MNVGTYSKEATATGTYVLNLATWLAGRTVSSATWTVPAGIVKESESNTTTTATVQFSGGTWATSYEPSVLIVCNNGDEETFSITLKIQYSVAYCTMLELRALAQGMTASGSPPATDNLIVDLIERVSRLFDLECGVPEGYFNPPLYPTATARTFYGDGTNHLKLDPYIAGTLNTTLVYPDGYTAPDFIERDGYLLLTSSTHILEPFRLYPHFVNGWNDRVPIVITAKWGFPNTPADVKLAVIEWIINVWRETDPASQRLVNLDGMALREKCPPRVMEVIKRYRMSAAKAVFV